MKNPLRAKPHARRKPLADLHKNELQFLLSSGKAVAIRKAFPSDASSIVKLYDSVAAEGVHITPEAYPWSEEAEKDFIRLEKMQGSGRFIAFADGEAVAECSVIRHPAPKRRHTATLQMAVTKEFRRMGIGGKILARALGWAASEGIEKVTLECFSTNGAALALYRKAGFFEEGSRAKQIRIRGKYADEIIMGIFLKALERRG